MSVIFDNFTFTRLEDGTLRIRVNGAPGADNWTPSTQEIVLDGAQWDSLLIEVNQGLQTPEERELSEALDQAEDQAVIAQTWLRRLIPLAGIKLEEALGDLRDLEQDLYPAQEVAAGKYDCDCDDCLCR